MEEVDFITNLAPHYRKRLWLELLKLKDYRLRFFYGREPRSSIKQIDFEADQWAAFSGHLTEIKNVRAGGVLCWQSGVVGRAIKTPASISVFLGDMYVLSTWVAVAVLRARGRRIVFWGHGIYGSESWLKRCLRLAFLRMADINLVYGERARQLLIEQELPEERVRVIYNSLDYPTQLALRESAIDVDFFARMGWFAHSDLPVLIFVGRLTRQKRLDLLISAIEALNETGQQFNLLLVGDGPERASLQNRAADEHGWIHFHGACYDELNLAKMIANADLCVSPGEIGLTAIHALSYGTPVCTHGDFSRQMPEAEAIIEGVTGTFFDQKKKDLGERIEAWFKQNRDRDAVRAACYKIIDEKFNPTVQARIFREALVALAYTK